MRLIWTSGWCSTSEPLIDPPKSGPWGGGVRIGIGPRRAAPPTLPDGGRARFDRAGRGPRILRQLTACHLRACGRSWRHRPRQWCVRRAVIAVPDSRSRFAVAAGFGRPWSTGWRYGPDETLRKVGSSRLRHTGETECPCFPAEAASEVEGGSVLPQPPDPCAGVPSATPVALQGRTPAHGPNACEFRRWPRNGGTGLDSNRPRVRVGPRSATECRRAELTRLFVPTPWSTVFAAVEDGEAAKAAACDLLRAERNAMRRRRRVSAGR